MPSSFFKKKKKKRKEKKRKEKKRKEKKRKLTRDDWGSKSICINDLLSKLVAYTADTRLRWNQIEIGAGHNRGVRGCSQMTPSLVY